VTICEDMWQPGPPATDLALAGAELIVNISASPFHLLRDREREEMFRTRARDAASYVAFCNTIGGQDELIFDGHSLVIDDEGTVLARAPGFQEALVLIDIEPSAVVTRRLTDTRRRALAQDRGPLGAVETIHVGAPHEQKTPSRRRSRRSSTTSSRCASRSSSGSRTTCARTASRRSSSASRADRLGARCGARGGSARYRTRALRLDAVALLVGGDAR